MRNEVLGEVHTFDIDTDAHGKSGNGGVKTEYFGNGNHVQSLSERVVFCRKAYIVDRWHVDRGILVGQSVRGKDFQLHTGRVCLVINILAGSRIRSGGKVDSCLGQSVGPPAGRVVYIDGKVDGQVGEGYEIAVGSSGNGADSSGAPVVPKRNI